MNQALCTWVSRALRAATLACAGVACVAIFSAQARATNDVLTQWNFNTATASGASMTFGPIAADTGTGSATGVHAGSATWSTPAGNGSAKSFSSNVWAVGDYYQFQTSATGASNLGIKFDQVSSTTGPRDWTFQYSLTGLAGSFTDFASYSVQPNNIPAWSSAGPVLPAVDTYDFDLRGVSALNNAGSVYLRLTDAAAIQANGTATAPPASGTDRVDNFSIFSNYDPTVAPVTPMVQVAPLPVAGGIAFATNSNRNKLTIESLQGQATPTSGGGAKVGGNGTISPFTSATFVNFVKFDNTGGTAHNFQGNLLAVDPGASATAGGNIYSSGTQGSLPLPAVQKLATTNTASTFATRLSGLSVSPLNTKIAVAGSDTGKVLVYDYTAGNTLGAGASLSGGRQTSTAPLTVVAATAVNQGTAWLNDSTVLSFSTAGSLSEIDATSMTATVKATVGTPNIGQDSTALAYNPSVSPKYLYALYSGFNATLAPLTTSNQLFVFDTTNNYQLVKTVDFSTTDLNTTPAATARDIALDKNGNLFISSGGGKVSFIPDVVSNPAGLASNLVATPWYTSETFQLNASFDGLDIGFAPAGVLGDYNGNNIVDAADYPVWRDHLGQTFALPNRNPLNSGVISMDDYTYWVSRFGAISGAGSVGGGAVPEPASLALVAIGLVGLVVGRRRLGR